MANFKQSYMVTNPSWGGNGWWKLSQMLDLSWLQFSPPCMKEQIHLLHLNSEVLHHNGESSKPRQKSHILDYPGKSCKGRDSLKSFGY